MISLVKQLKEGGFITCLPQQPRIDTAVISKLQCQLKVQRQQIILHLHPVRDCLQYRRGPIVDDNGEVVTLLDPDLDRKFVVAERDLNLYFALKNEDLLNDEDVLFEIVLCSQGRYR